MPANSEPTTPIARRHAAAGERVQLELIADDRKLPERAVEDPLLLAGVALQDEAEDRHEHEQQREQRDEAVVGDQRGELSGLVVAELLDHGRDEADPRAPLLAAVERAQAVGDAHLSFALGGQMPAVRRAGANWRGGPGSLSSDTPMCLPDGSPKNED